MEELISPSVAAAAEIGVFILVDAAVKGGVVLALAALAVTRLRRSSADTRHTVWLASLSCLLTIPMLSAVVPKCRVIPILCGMGQPQTLTFGVVRSPSTDDFKRSVEWSTDETSPFSAHTETRSSDRRIRLMDTAPLEVPTESNIVSDRNSRDWSSIRSWAVFAAAIWGTGATILLLRLGASRFLLWQAVKTSTPLDLVNGHLVPLIDNTVKQLQLRRAPQLYLSNRRTVPMTWGLLHPIVLLPSDFGGWEPATVRAVLFHEFGHIKRYDTASHVLSQIIGIVYWFHPLVWWVLSRIRVEREHACDDLVLTSGNKASDYAEALARMFMGWEAPRVPCPALGIVNQMEARIMAVLEERRSRQQTTRARVTLVFMLAALVSVVLAGFSTRQSTARASEGTATPDNSSATGTDAASAGTVSPPSDEESIRDENKAYFEADFTDDDLIGAKLAGEAAFQRANFQGADLTNAILSGGDGGFQEASFEDASAGGAELLGGAAAFQLASFKDARLRGATLAGRGGAFQKADFEKATLERATFVCDSPAAMQGANLTGANFDMADLRMVHPRALESCTFAPNDPPRFTSATRFSEGFSPQLAGWRRMDTKTTGLAPESSLKILVIDSLGRPLDGARVFQNHVYLPRGAANDRKHDKIRNQYYATDDQGAAELTWEGESVDLRLWISKDGYVPQHAMWSKQFQPDGDQIPAEFTFQLTKGTTIGGVIRDKLGKPIAGARVEIENRVAMSNFYSVPQPQTGPSERPIPPIWLAEGAEAIVTDANGHWQATNVPADTELMLTKFDRPPDVIQRLTRSPLGLRVSHAKDV